MHREQVARASITDWLDRTAIGASFLCLIHCAGLPLLLAALPALSRGIAIPERFHLWMLAFAIPMSAIALVAALRRHGRGETLVLGSIGLALMTTGALAFAETSAETAMTIGGSLCLASAHILNLHRRHWPHRHG
ncbi:MerC domain-containing protein [Sphingomonas sp. DG1-23]|uniref:MerC domain-containing protein n=1 Tax=Sphingomonas sp. DG1-23 TaxID=3068316 RepID=UPI0027402FE5|nr:MerC domain-containing protein [Sphingomonas sp. DG1-23]MDP5280032.1 MerC domain-containing protein [Sphingomonas sp. DG1-23]